MELKQKRRTSAAVKNRYNEKAYDQIRFIAKKTSRIPDALTEAVSSGKAASKNAYIYAAVVAALERDGIVIGSDPSQREE